MYDLIATGRFKKDLKGVIKRGYDIALLDSIVELLVSGGKLPEKNKDHALSGNWVRHRECHITPDWLLVYTADDNLLILTLTRTGTHSDLF
ncbi:MAG: type II toxin-antitoxin system YafQ family toxin [Lachnospiraceae bacterium]